MKMMKLHSGLCLWADAQNHTKTDMTVRDVCIHLSARSLALSFRNRQLYDESVFSLIESAQKHITTYANPTIFIKHTKKCKQNCRNILTIVNNCNAKLQTEDRNSIQQTSVSSSSLRLDCHKRTELVYARALETQRKGHGRVCGRVVRLSTTLRCRLWCVDREGSVCGNYAQEHRMSGLLSVVQNLSRSSVFKLLQM